MGQTCCGKAEIDNIPKKSDKPKKNGKPDSGHYSEETNENHINQKIDYDSDYDHNSLALESVINKDATARSHNLSAILEQSNEEGTVYN